MMTTMRSASTTVPPPGRIDARIVGLTLLVKLGVLALGVIAVALLGQAIAPETDGTSADPRWLFAPWVRWDAPHYLDLAVFGYRATGVDGLVGPDGYRALAPGDLPFYGAFYPLFPWLTAAFVAVSHDPSLASFIVSGLALCVAGPLLFRLVGLEAGPAVGLRAVWFLLIFPTAYFLQIGYTESLFLVLVLGSFLAARTDRWWLAGILGALAALTRINGLVLIPALIAEAAVLWWPHRGPFDRRWLFIGLIPLGPLVYVALNQAVYGDPFAFLAIQSEHWHKALSPPWVGIGDLLHSSLPRAWIPELAFVALGIVATVVCARRFPLSWTVWMAGNLLLFTSTSLILSVPRYDLMLFPMFAWFGQLARTRSRLVVMSAVSIAGLAFFAGRFALGLWAF
jgi:Gpi18-like mannosyltransferase